MVARRERCDRNRLRLALDNRLQSPLETELADHLLTCESCRAELERLAGGDQWLNDVGRYLAAPRGISPAEPDANQASAALPTREAPPTPAEQPRLDFLSPSDDPSKLGRLGPYEISEVVGRGGMGLVLKAYDPALARQVAIKVLAAELATSVAARRRFAREAQAAAAVVHDHVVPIHAVDADGNVPYLVMPFIAGLSLQERLSHSGPLELREILRIGMQMASGLAAAHAQGLVHRDIKPANILLENGIERVRITDFGLARAVDDASLTQSGVVAGTPQYMSPEQARGEPVDYRTDLFSLGSVLYAMCAGHSPFRAENTLAVLRRICDGRPRGVREINPEIPAWLARIIEKLHAREPAERFQSAAEVADLLERHLAHLQHPTSAARPPDVRSPRRWGLPPRCTLRTLVGICVAVFLLAGAAAWQFGKPWWYSLSGAGQAQRDAAARPRQPRESAASRQLADWKLFQEELDRVLGETAALESTLRPCSPAPAAGSPAASVAEIHVRLDALEQELNPPSRERGRE